ncbi:LOW QUALITY PROTEIN: DDT domain-containing protein PTM-like [Andrographis paniculata]|uniref:LOW QUALITY PROTEIN: DDT domain-containing protein PTM-like n=1 Tax=Andrographis paniculata TaxID=175694 RepID=UPI0021E87201|nr:LOW QUALITY PROTEIN: DDT domain-containing protein PTM-like [Andrographis paniculata]
MECVGRRVMKSLEGGDAVFGMVRAYEPATGNCKIVYDGGDSEEVHWSGVYSFLVPAEAPPLPPSGSDGEAANKRRRVGNEGVGDGNSVGGSGVCCNPVGGNGDSAKSCRGLNKGFDLNQAPIDCSSDDELRGNAVGFDLNEAVCTELDERLQSNEGVSAQSSRANREILDLNSDANEALGSEGRGVRFFDLNLQYKEEKEQERGSQFESIHRICGEEDVQARGELMDDHRARGNSPNNVAGDEIPPQSAQRKSRGKKRKDPPNKDAELVKSELPKVDPEAGQENLPLRRKGKKRKEVPGNDNAQPLPVAQPKRSNHRARRAAASSSYQVFDALSSAALPPKVELPPSSCNLDLCGVSVADLVSVYSFLRSFSTLLFLSPFEFDDFLLSVKAEDSTLLFDSIHVSLLRTLKKHLESLSEEGSLSASNCLRSLNWNFLDVVTWPMFALLYISFHRPVYGPGLAVDQYLQNNYYKQPISTKVDILQHFCDDITEMKVFRTEINRRLLETERSTGFEHNIKMGRSTRRKPVGDVASISCVTEEDAEELTDGNNDECRLCHMEGNLICCDGCPAAFHSRCVGVVSSLLPDGDWYCPECTIAKDRPWMILRNPVRGQELLGIDPHGRAYYNSCGYLLVMESWKDDCLYRFYNRNDLATLIEALESTPFIYNSIINSVCKTWNVVHVAVGVRNDLDDRSYSIQSAFPESRQLLDNETFAERSREKSMPANSSCAEPVNAGLGTVQLETETHGVRLDLASPECSAEVSQTSIKPDSLSEAGLACSEKGADHFHSPGRLENAGNHCMVSTSLDAEKGRNFSLECSAPHNENSGVLSKVQHEANYVNHYELAKTASSYFENMTCKSSDNISEDATKSIEENVAGQLKVVSNRCAEFSWSNIQTSNLVSRRESCGWCCHCRVPEDERDCLFFMNDSIPAVESYTCNALGFQSRNSNNNHLIDIKCHYVCIEDHLHGLLLGPWLNPQYSMVWRKSVLEANNITSLKYLLLKLESNLHHLALSSEWQKHVDSAVTMGSAYHFVNNSARRVRVSLKHESGRKRTNPSKVKTVSSSKAASGMRLLWWRGRRISHTLFNWKVLPLSLASKAARQGGCKKIPGILYPESGEHAKRTKCVSWRAAVETSRNLEQLALQVRELDANIKWDEIGNNRLLAKVGKEAKNSLRSFKKVIIRRKCSEGTAVKYLLDFGKRRFIPDVAVIHGSMVEDSSSERKKYWLEESHVPLHLLKAFEEKRIARNCDVANAGKLGESSEVIIKPFRNKGFSYLFSRAETSEQIQCGHCDEDVLISEAVSCQYCQGFFHKKHVQKSAESVSAYTCRKCLGGEPVKVDTGNRKSGFPKVKNASKASKPSGKGKKRGEGEQPVDSRNTRTVPLVTPLRCSVRSAGQNARLYLHSILVKERKRCKRVHSEGAIKKPKNSVRKKKRTPVYSSYWLHGLRFCRRPNDERSMNFRNQMLLVSSGEMNFICDKPKCCLCKELEYKSELNYLACEICGAWFHGDALNLTADKIEHIISFKCHMCLDKRPPLCPHHFPVGSTKGEFVSEN